MGASNLLRHPSKALEQMKDENHALGQRVREALWQSQVQQTRSQDWFNFASDGYLLTDGQGLILEANHAATTFLGTRKVFLLGKPLGLLMRAEDQRSFYQHLARLADYGGIESWEVQLRHSNVEARDVVLTAAALPGDQGQVGKVRWMLQDVSPARQAERAWLAEKNLADNLLEMADVLILVVEEGGAILRSNPYAANVCGYDAGELLGKNWGQLLLPDHEREVGRQLLHQARSTGASRSGVLDLATRSGERCQVLWSMRKLGRMVLLIGQNVTELQEAQQQTLKSEHMAALGQMAAGLAHEGRNALQRIQACLAILSIRFKEQPDNLELLGRIQRAQDDLLHLFEDVRNYAVTPRLQRRWHDLRQSWRDAWSDLASLPPWQSAELQEDIAAVDPFCDADPFYLKHLFRNLLENALTCGADPVRIILSCREMSLDGEEAICLRLRDNGPGIAAEAQARLFEPFCTTKAAGTGLGLAICKRIVEAHGGRIEANEQSVSGAEIVIALPRRES